MVLHSISLPPGEYGTDAVQRYSDQVVPAGPDEFDAEYLSLDISAAVVPDLEAAVRHVRRWSSHMIAGRSGLPFPSVATIVARCVVTATPAMESRATPGCARSARVASQTVFQ